ncbi:energy transducer TonB family protein [Pseudodesulfovibrio senegalensis]|uniref:TonB C-terminal domain-containing protein n=1 Tax=Pseudodesulfovibrio senegalensis TaxID=1721087 RepID=A0A6N6MYB0_9BACT|nr:TonB C-terminal domain-containing protein [Pseudodesulfovibrio senegalensis]KAB1440266.1 hypothetical protein F8A88_13520 [Pseudodesulfovibrio senegalensis]
MKNLLAASIAFSLFAHFILLEAHWTPSTSPGTGQTVIPISLESPGSPQSDPSSMHSAPTPEQEAGQGADAFKRKQQAALKRFLKAVRKAIESKKFDSATGISSSMIGNAVCAFTILENDSFAGVRLVRTSGNAKLDRAALTAIRLASGATHRPKIIGTGHIPLTLTVKYQYGM